MRTRPRRVVGLLLSALTVLPVAACATGRDGIVAAGLDPDPTATRALDDRGAAPPVPEPGPTTRAAPAARYVFPVDGKVGYAKDKHHDYPAADIIAACGLTVRAVTDGVVLEVNRVDRYDRKTNKGGDRGGLFVSVLGDDGVRYYGSHYSEITKGLTAGDRVRAGAVLGRIGRTGDAGACHLHFGLSPVCARTADWWVRRGVIWPARYLDAWRRGESRSPGAAIEKWRKSHGCPAKAPAGA
ncbi:hypothetical protein GCM10009682_33810 [Luedemannella flava]|uniref:M23ase beta-sheet core domain-containing protein n=1 Tax=Luedemannella flava TaxID=349316 RepID=A0ABP4YI96_9ACTN